ncbi:carbonic anhydrase [Russula ochroleuca]|jgi:carbonic anhydrase|uniref:Carbonic anhydrase n=1 Tax=Russula ochroleuca TaxID=152965 RepID=A0A9P5JU94_9AGAM|nr:carbonic anhydrase [Russula ochroleuca]KAF8464190.1 carbonic anhydrase [Russula ochroleuca]
MSDAATLSSPLANNPELADNIIGPPPHTPTILWIGCSDARVPESVWSPPPAVGEVFVQRNIANQFQPTDVNAVSVLTYGVTGIPTIKEVRVVGHTGCAGVQACYNVVNNIPIPPPPPPDSVLWTWLGPLRAHAHANRHQTLEWLTKENVRIQMRNVNAMLRSLGRADVAVNGYLYDIGNRRIYPVPPSD